MPLSLEHIDACLPISALRVLTWGEEQYIFQGQGTLFRVVNATTGAVSTQIQAFKRNNVHGFIPLNQPQDETDTVQVLVWGGRSVRVIDFHLQSSATPHLSISSAEYNAPDWIMSGCAAAAGHCGGFLITANNALLSLEVTESNSPERKTDISVYQLVTSVKSILYSADVIALSASHVLMAAGTVFGEIIVWSCFLSDDGLHKANAVGSIHHFFTGHEGSIFNVRISPQILSLNPNQPGRFLASCSDDRTVRIWDISDCENKTAQDPSAYATDGYDLRSTGFGPVGAGDQTVGSESCVVQAFGHAARIWGVYFRSIQNKDQTHVGLVSRGEDCTCVMWDLSWQKSSDGATRYEFTEASSIQPHIGKHIWSLDLHRLDSETVAYTGGADGALKRFSIKENDDTQLPVRPAPEPEIPGFQRKRKQPTTDRARAFAFVSPSCLLCVSTNGQVQLGHMDQTGRSTTSWEVLREVPDLGSFAVISGLPQKGLALIGNSRGLIQIYDHAARSFTDVATIGSRPLGLFFLETNSPSTQPSKTAKEITFLVCYPTKEEATLVTASGWNSDSFKTHAVTFKLPSSFVVCSAALIFEGQYLMIGSKAGGLAVYQTPKNDETSEPTLIDRRIHGREFVNHIHTVSSSSGSDGTQSDFVLTCGRDGTYCLHEMRLDGNKTDTLSMRIVHRTASMIGGNIEGAYVDELTGDFMLYGFRSQEWVLRNESKLTDIINIASGGFRRDWAFSPGSKDANACFVWRDDASLVVTHIQPDASHLLRAGGHGRELKAVDVFSAPEGGRSLIATGAEDTTVRLFAPTSLVSASPWGTFECVRVLDTHKSGIQQVSWSKDGKYLFTSAAFEEFFVWRVRAVPSFGIATNLLAASPKDDPNSDLRILSFDLLEVKEVDRGQGFLLCLTFSNSTIKIFHFSPSGCHFSLLTRGTYMTNCLTQAHFLVTGSSVNLITAATDGFFTLWDLTTTLESFYTMTDSVLEAKHAFNGSSAPADDITCEGRYQIHSNSIKGMELVPLSETATAIVAGGDDNTISVSLLRTSSTTTGPRANVATVSIPDAHAAAVTTVKVLSQHNIPDTSSNTASTKITVATSGNDHRVKIWSIVVDPAQPGTQGISVEFLLDRYSAVADVSSLGLVRKHGSVNSSDSDVPGSQNSQAQLVVCGVGMEMFGVED